MARQSTTRSRPNGKGDRSADLFTIGHSTHEIGVFLDMVKAHHVTRVVDVRTVPRSRHNPQYNTDALAKSLAAAGIGYIHLPALGGLRHPRADSPNTGWRNASFRGFADYMQTPPFDEALAALISMSQRECLALMCAEAVPWRCHRSLIADALTLHGLHVSHIVGTDSVRPHLMTSFARVSGERVTYPQPWSSR